jgi:hypothetical protein
MMRILFFLLFITVFSRAGFTQDNLWLWEVSTHFGGIIKHTKKMDHLNYNNSLGGDVSISRQSNGSKAWQHGLGMPEIGATMIITDFGNQLELGSSIGIAPHVTFRARRKVNTFEVKIGTGIAWLSKPYDQLTNPTNTAIGSAFNNLTFFRFTRQWVIKKYSALHLGVIYKHYSNGAIKAPNLGFNVPSLTFGFKKYLAPLKRTYKPDTVMPSNENWGFRSRIALAIKEDQTPNGPKYPVYIFSSSLTKRLTHVNRVGLGFYGSYYSPIYDYLINFEIFEPEERRKKALRLGVEVSHELLLGKFGVDTQLGYYVKNDFFKVSNIYSRLGVLYYFHHHRFFTGIYLKSNEWTADYIESTAGVRF